MKNFSNGTLLFLFFSLTCTLLPARQAGHVAKSKDAVPSAREQFLAGTDDTAAEAKLTEGNLNPTGTAEWYLESANGLLQIAFSVARTGKPERAAQIARRALYYANEAAKSEGASLLVAAAADETAALIQEKLLADYAGAKAAYESAARRNPQGGAAKAVDRLNRMEQEGNRKNRNPNG